MLSRGPSSFSASGNNAAPKKMVLKPFKSQPKLPDNYEVETWAKLQAALVAVNTKVSTPHSKEELYRAVEDLCMHKLSAKIYDSLVTECSRFIESRVDTLSHKTSDPTAFLKLVESVWQDHCDVMINIRNIFLYLDRSYALSTPGVKSVWDVAIDRFRERLETLSEVEVKIIVGLLSSIELYRQGREVDTDTVHSILRMLSALNVYKQKFETPFLVDSKRFFTYEGLQLMDHCDTPQFLAHVDRRLHEVNDMVAKFLDASSKQPLVEIIEQHLLCPHVPVLLERGLKQILDGDRIGDLKRLHQLLERVHMGDQLRLGWSNYIKALGEVYVGDEEREKTLIDDILALKDRLDVMLKQSFGTDENFKDALKASLDYVINIKPTKESVMMARYIDRKMRGEKGVTEEETEAALDKFMALFKLLQSKDVFEAFYKKFLSKRLFLGKSASYELEKLMLSKLKAECGSNFTSKLEGMFQDIEISRDVMQEYMQYCERTGSATAADASAPSSSSSLTTAVAEPEVVIQTLTTGYWPTCLNTDALVLPSSILPIIQRFDHFYTNKYQGRRLAWAHALARCIVTARFPKGRKELELSFLQGVVLLCFNRADKLSFTQLLQATQLDDSELRRTLQSLACGMPGTRVLSKEPRGKDVNDDDEFLYNNEFTNKLFRIKISTIQAKETSEEDEKTHEEVFRERQYQVDAAIVRIMKTRKRLSHQILISELMAQIKFPAKTSDLKQRIESLIEREYLERDRDDNSFYSYLA